MVVVAALALGIAVGRLQPSAAGSQVPDRTTRPPVQDKGYINSYIALLRSDIRAKKTGIIAESLSLNAKESAAFWPIYKRYESDLTGFYDGRLQLIKDYAASFDKMDDARARELSRRAFALEEQRLSLRREYSRQLEKVLPGKTLIRYFMLERRLDMLIDLKIASEIPIIE